MISRNDCFLLLADLEKNGVDTKQQISELVNSQSVPVSVVQYINENRQLDLTQFYEKIRKSYNNKKSNLYINIVKEVEDPNEVLTTLSALLTQILLFSRNTDNKQMFLRHARANDISTVLNMYFTKYDLTYCIKLLKLIKSDIKCLESFKKAS